MKASKVLVTCPQCGHTQPEPASAYSSRCRQCQQYFRLEDVRAAKSPSALAEPSPGPPREMRRITCFQCGTDLEVAPTAQSTMCKRCSAHLDLKDHQISSAVSKNFRTKGRIVIEEGGFLFNTETTAHEAVVKGRFLGKLVVERTLEIQRTADIKGTFKAGRMLIPAGHAWRWTGPLALADAEIAGELVASMQATGTIVIRSSGRVFGDIDAAHLVVESGAILVGRMRINAR